MRRSNSFFKNEQGAVALIVGICLVLVLIAVLSLSVDMTRTQTSYNKNQGATDGAATAAAELWLKTIVNNIGVTPNPLATPYPSQTAPGQGNYAETVLKQNFSRDQSSGILDESSIVVEPTPLSNTTSGETSYNVKVYACANLNTAIASAAGHTKGNTNCGNDGACTRTCTTSNASFTISSLKNLEVAFALDFTSSMYWGGEFGACSLNADNSGDPANCPAPNQTKAYNLWSAMNDVLSNPAYFPPGGSVYASITPFSSIVNLYPYNKSMVTTTSTHLDHATNVDGAYGPYTNFQVNGLDPSGDSYQKNTLEYNYTDYGMYGDNNDKNQSGEQRSYEYFETVLDRIPSFDDGIFNAILSDTGNDFAGKEFNSYRSVYNNYLTEDHYGARYVCYNAALVAALDQRIERTELRAQNAVGIGNPNIGNIYMDNKAESPQADLFPDTKVQSCTDLDCFTRNGIAGATARRNTLYESFPIQPLTNNTQILTNVVNRFKPSTISTLYTSAQNFPPSANPDDPTPANTIDRQSRPITRSLSWSANTQTSGIHGLMWAWFTINNHWKGLWNDESVHESYYSSGPNGGPAADGNASKQSRQQLPSSENTKHIIMITDGHDNDGTAPGVTNPVHCDAYSPTGQFTTDKYLQLCNRIKAEDIQIDILLLDSNDTNNPPRLASCASPGKYHENVQPQQIDGIMNGIFRDIIKSLTTVKLVR